jgi:YjbE family integral membrane protein
MFSSLFDPEAMGAFFSVIVIDLVLAGDNAVVVGMAAAGLPPAEQRRVIAIGIAFATVLRIVLALVTVQLLAIIGLTLAGGILLLWVAWKMYRDLKPTKPETGAEKPVKRRSFRQALFQVVLADVSMSLDNILAVAGTARDHLWVLISGLILSVALMGVASTIIARVLDRYHWIAWLGLAIVAFVALRMIYDGSAEVLEVMEKIRAVHGR